MEMIEITQATYGGRIHYTAKQEVNTPLQVILKDKNLEGLNINVFICG